MGKPTGFTEYERESVPDRSPAERVGDFREFHLSLNIHERREQGARCMDCGVPFCQSDHGCPIDNLIPEWNDLVYHNRWGDALERLHKTNNFPEFTGRVCPAPCEGACCLNVYGPAVTIKDNECAIVDRGFNEGLVAANPPETRTGRTVAIIGSGPAGLAAADQLNQAGHTVTVYERDDRIGGLLMYGIPNMKLDKATVQRRVDLLEAEGITFVTRAHVGVNVDAKKLAGDFDAVLLACGSTRPRDLPIPGRGLNGVHFAMPYLTCSTQRVLDGDDHTPTHTQRRGDGPMLDAKDKRVIVIGGGDTGNDCLGTALRQGCRSLINFELMPQPPEDRADDNPWPQWPRILRTDYGHAEARHVFGKDPREFSILSKRFIDDGQGNLAGVETVRIEWQTDSAGRRSMVEVPGSKKVFDADLVFLAMGFLGPENTVAEQFGVTLDDRGNHQAAYGEHATNVPNVFTAGDCRRGQSLVVWAIAEGRAAARAIDTSLMGHSDLPAPDVAAAGA